MCETCRQLRCPSGCPNAADPEPALSCDRCHGAIYGGEDYIDLEGKRICLYCLEDMDTHALLDLFDIPYYTAKVPLPRIRPLYG